MKSNRIVSIVAAAGALLTVWGNANATAYTMLGWYQRESTTLSSLSFKSGAAQGCPGPTYKQPCYNPANAWVVSTGIATTVEAAGQPAWDWNGTTLSMTGTLIGASYIASNVNSSGGTIIADKVVDLSITPGTSTTTAASYECIEGLFIASVGGNACKNTALGNNGTDDTTTVWNAGGNVLCVTEVINDDDYSLVEYGAPTPVPTGYPTPGYDHGTPEARGLVTTAAGVAGAGCVGTGGAFEFWKVAKDDGNILIIASGNQATMPAGVASLSDLKCIYFGPTQYPSCPSSTKTPTSTPTSIADSYIIFVRVGAPDTDGDGVPNGLDNCTNTANANQLDVDGDGYGNICDGDINNSNTTNTADYGLLRSVLGTNWIWSGAPIATTTNKADMNGYLSQTTVSGSSATNTADYGLLRARLGTPPGPSGLAP